MLTICFVNESPMLSIFIRMFIIVQAISSHNNPLNCRAKAAMPIVKGTHSENLGTSQIL